MSTGLDLRTRDDFHDAAALVMGRNDGMTLCQARRVVAVRQWVRWRIQSDDIDNADDECVALVGQWVKNARQAARHGETCEGVDTDKGAA